MLEEAISELEVRWQRQPQRAGNLSRYLTGGWNKVIACTLYDRAFAADQTQYDPDRAAFNVIVSGWVGVHADAVLDLAEVTDMGANGDHTNATYFQAGGVLPTAAGDAFLAMPTVTAINSI